MNGHNELHREGDIQSQEQTRNGDQAQSNGDTRAGEPLQSNGEAGNTEQTPGEVDDDERTDWGPECAAHLIPTGGQCLNPARIPCEICHLAAYCSQECKEMDLKIHGYECPPRLIDAYECPPSNSESTDDIPDDPIFDTGVFWANYAATDILNLAENEGAEYNGRLRILLAGTFGLRHLIYSFTAMPETACPFLEVTISEMELPHLFRTLLSLFILLEGEARNMNPYHIADLVINVWYAYKWPPTVRYFLNEKLGVMLSDLTSKVTLHFADLPSSDNSCLGLFWESSETYLRLDVSLDRLHWNEMLSYLKGPVCNEDVEELRDIDVKRYGESLDRAFARMSPSRVATMLKWRKEGIVLPFSDSASPYTDLNPMFFPAKRRQPGGITNEPLSEWPMSGILDYTPYAAKEDVYGKMLVYVRDMLVNFQLRLKKTGMQIKLMAAGTMQMAGHIATFFDYRPDFDRIEAGHLFDIHPELCLLSFSLLLRHEEENPFATMLTMTRESVILSKSPHIKKLIAAEKHSIYHSTSEPLDSIIPPMPASGNKYSAACLPRHFALLLYRNWDLFSDRYLTDASVFGFTAPGDTVSDRSERSNRPKRSVLQTGYLGLRLKPKNKVALRWPNRLVYGKSSNPTAEQVMRWMSWSTTKPERWLEWKRVRDVTYSEWTKYLAMLEGEEAARDWDKNWRFITRELKFIQREEEYEKTRESEGEDRMDIDGADENAGSSMAGENENDDWMMVDPTESEMVSEPGSIAKKSNNRKKKKKSRK